MLLSELAEGCSKLALGYNRAEVVHTAMRHSIQDWLTGHRLRVAIGPLAALLALPPAGAQIGRAASASHFVVVLDAAHGGDDAGAQIGTSNGGSPIAEKTATLELSVRLRSLLAARGFTVITTREGTGSLTADARAQIADRAVAAASASACLSLHATESGSGVHLFVSSLAPVAIAKFLPWKTAQAAFVSQSLKLAGTVHAALEHTSVAGGGSSSAPGEGSGTGPIPATLGRAALPGIDSMTCPAVAIEIAPIRSGDRSGDRVTERTVLTPVTDSEYQTQLVDALAAALLAWKSELEGGPEAESAPLGGARP